MIVAIVLTISLLLDGILTNFLACMPNDLSLFTPLLTVASIFIIYPFYRKKEKKYYLHMFLLGIIYDLFYTNLLFWNGLLFLGMAFLSKIIHKNFEIGCLRLIFYIAIEIIIYECLNVSIIWVFHLVPITFSKLFYKITHSLLLNILYIEFIYILLNLIPKKYRKISINL